MFHPSFIREILRQNVEACWVYFGDGEFQLAGSEPPLHVVARTTAQIRPDGRRETEQQARSASRGRFPRQSLTPRSAPAAPSHPELRAGRPVLSLARRPQLGWRYRCRRAIRVPRVAAAFGRLRRCRKPGCVRDRWYALLVQSSVNGLQQGSQDAIAASSDRPAAEIDTPALPRSTSRSTGPAALAVAAPWFRRRCRRWTPPTVRVGCRPTSVGSNACSTDEFRTGWDYRGRDRVRARPRYPRVPAKDRFDVDLAPIPPAARPGQHADSPQSESAGAGSFGVLCAGLRSVHSATPPRPDGRWGGSTRSR